MMGARENMSKTLVPLASVQPLQLDFVAAGELSPKFRAQVHVKTIPYTILAQTIEGRYEVRCQGRHEIIPVGGVFVVPANTEVEITHHAGRSGVMRARWAHLRFSYYGLLDYLSCFDIPLRLPRQTGLRVGDVIRQLMEIRESVGPVALARRHELAMCLLGIVCEVSPQLEDAGRMETRYERLQPVLRHIRLHLGEPLSVQALAAAAALSPVHFHEVFRETFGVSPMRYVRGIRLEAASRLLAATDHPIARVAESVGFIDPFHFSHVFSRHFGLSPRAYRQQAAGWSTS